MLLETRKARQDCRAHGIRVLVAVGARKVAAAIRIFGTPVALDIRVNVGIVGLTSHKSERKSVR